MCTLCCEISLDRIRTLPKIYPMAMTVVCVRVFVFWGFSGGRGGGRGRSHGCERADPLALLSSP